ncbi:MAG: divergent polysaccharide deacetylase family protein [Candidatus Margulisbacteria bacterium]|nr:divergent polysaccharide deacetylase family protein [Candidatus Margulisiibacteriota bacterium]
MIKSKKYLRAILYYCLLAVLSITLIANLVWPAQKTVKPKIAIILDDAGSPGKYYKELYSLPSKVTVAIIPGTTWAKKVAEESRKRGYEVIGHIPMEPIKEKANKASIIHTGLDETQINKRLDNFIKMLPGIDGINNHMGSKVSIHRPTLEAIMKDLKRRKMFMIDSATHWRSIIPRVAKEYNVPCLINNQFLDGTQDEKIIEKNILKIMKLAKKRGYAVGIGHVPRATTLKVLKKIMLEYKDQVDFVGVSEIIYKEKTEEVQSSTLDVKEKNKLDM